MRASTAVAILSAALLLGVAMSQQQDAGECKVEGRVCKTQRTSATNDDGTCVTLSFGGGGDGGDGECGEWVTEDALVFDDTVSLFELFSDALSALDDPFFYSSKNPGQCGVSRLHPDLIFEGEVPSEVVETEPEFLRQLKQDQAVAHDVLTNNEACSQVVAMSSLFFGDPSGLPFNVRIRVHSSFFIQSDDENGAFHYGPNFDPAAGVENQQFRIDTISTPEVTFAMAQSDLPEALIRLQQRAASLLEEPIDADDIQVLRPGANHPGADGFPLPLNAQGIPFSFDIASNLSPAPFFTAFRTVNTNGRLFVALRAHAITIDTQRCSHHPAPDASKRRMSAQNSDDIMAKWNELVQKLGRHAHAQ